MCTTRKADGFALIDLLFVCAIIGILVSIALPRLVLARQVAGSASAIGSLRAVNSAQLTYAITCGSGFYAPNLTTLGTAPSGSVAAFISADLGASNAVTKSGYTVQVAATGYAGAPASCNGLAAGDAGQGFKAGADAVEPGNVRFFATNANGLIYEDTSSLYASMPEVGAPSSGHPIR
jgi:type II secretory pathway pseudopilin PulG